MNMGFIFPALESTLPSPSETLLSIRLLDFKTSLLEAIEELRIRRETENNYEDQINKIVIEKQELEWQKVCVLVVFYLLRFNFNGKYQLAVETKEKEIDGLKETLKALQISKYTLQKKLNEMDQKLQMHLTAKEEHHKKLNEVERCYATIASRFGIVKGVHGKLEHSVQEAIQHNKKLASVNKRQETEISNLKEVSAVHISEWRMIPELKKVTTDLIRSKVTSQYRVGEENINLAVKEKQFQELQQKIRMVFWILNKLKNKILLNIFYSVCINKEILSSLQCVQELLQRITQTNVRMESELKALKEDYQALERDNELQREKAKENEEKFLNLQNEHEKALRTWKNDSLTREYPHSTGSQVLENSFKDEINVASPCEVKQREVSPRNTLCTDTDLITQGHTWEMHVPGCREAEGTAHRTLPDENNADSDQKPQGSPEPLAAHHTQTRKDSLGGAEAVGADRINRSLEHDSSKEGLCNTADQSACAKADANSDTTQHNKSVLTPEAPKPESEAVLCTEKSALCDRSADNHQAKELSFSILPYINSQAEYQKCSLLNSDNSVGSGLHKTEKNFNLSGLHRDKLPLDQTHIDVEGRNDDNARNMNSTGVLATDAQHPPAVCCDNTSADDAAAKECRDNKSLLGTFNLYPPKTERGVNADDMHSNQPEQSSAKQTGNATNPWTSSPEAKSPVKADGLEIAHKNPPADRACPDKLIPHKNVNNGTQIHSIKAGHSLEINASTNNTLLKEKKDSLSGTVPGMKFAEGHLKEPCSLPMRTSGNLVNISVRSSFDLPTSDKKAEKTPLYLNFLALSSCSRVNQMRGQATWALASKEPSLLKDKPACLVENTNIVSNTQSQDLSENGDSCSSLNRAANTLNASSIHQEPQGEPSEEWNATAKAFYDSSFPTEHVSQLKILQTRPQ
uniref:Coiled-coil domain containing 73 n=1 Tax=Serinus canaria TaxID=9135 RepID=A0A8C9MZM3_SERCA